jgi:ATP-dependent RNA helicase DeaD
MQLPELLPEATTHEVFKRLKTVIAQQDLSIETAWVKQWADALHVDPVLCAAALWHIQQNKTPAKPQLASQNLKSRQSTPNRLVRYRLDVGSQHQVTREQIQLLLVQESGVEQKRIGRIDLRDTHTLVDLPEGMPADIFQILFEATLADRKLAIKRMKPNRRFRPKDR